MNAAGTLPIFTPPSAVRFTRPITVKVESTYQKPDGTPTGVATNVPTMAALGLNPAIGTYYSGNAYGDVKRFDAPEFIYLE